MPISHFKIFTKSYSAAAKCWQWAVAAKCWHPHAVLYFIIPSRYAEGILFLHYLSFHHQSTVIFVRPCLKLTLMGFNIQWKPVITRSSGSIDQTRDISGLRDITRYVFPPRCPQMACTRGRSSHIMTIFTI